MHLWAERPIPKHGPDERAKRMKRWDGLMDGYIKWCEQRGLSEMTVNGLRCELETLGLLVEAAAAEAEPGRSGWADAH